MEGWISLHRKIEENWIWKSREPFDRRSAWISLLLKVNHKDSKIMMNGKLLEVKKGSFITSELKLANEWKWGRKKVRIFLQSLEDDKMLSKKSTTKYTTITIENWAIYQNREQQKNSPGTTQEQHRNTDNNDNNDNNKYIVEIINHLNQVCKTNYKTSTQNTQKHINARLNEGYIVNDFKKVIDSKYKEWANNAEMKKYLRPETLFGTKFEGYLQNCNEKNEKIYIDENGDEVHITDELTQSGFIIRKNGGGIKLI